MHLIHESIKIIKNEGLMSFLSRLINCVGRDLRIFFAYIRVEFNPHTKFHMKDLKPGIKSAERKNTAITQEAIARIVQAYKKTETDQREQEKPYQISGDWEIIIQENYDEIVEKINRGLSRSGNFPVTYMEKIRLLLTIKRNYTVWKLMTGFPDEVLDYTKEIGNMHGVDHNGYS